MTWLVRQEDWKRLRRGQEQQRLSLLKGKEWRDGELKALKLLGEYSNRGNNSFPL